MKEHIMGCDVFQPLFAQNGIYFSFRIKIFSNLILQIANISFSHGLFSFLNIILVECCQLFPNRFSDVIRYSDILVVRDGLDLIKHFF